MQGRSPVPSSSFFPAGAPRCLASSQSMSRNVLSRHSIDVRSFFDRPRSRLDRCRVICIVDPLFHPVSRGYRSVYRSSWDRKHRNGARRRSDERKGGAEAFGKDFFARASPRSGGWTFASRREPLRRGYLRFSIKNFREPVSLVKIRFPLVNCSV